MNNKPRGELVPGGLAMIIGAKVRKDHIGRIVNLVEFLEVGQLSKWTCPTTGIGHRNVDVEPLWLVEGNVVGMHSSGADFIASGALIAPRFLLPINPSADPLEITRQMEEKV